MSQPANPDLTDPPQTNAPDSGLLDSTGGVRLLLRSLRHIMAEPRDHQARLDGIVALIAQNMKTTVCSIYLRRGAEMLELCASEGLNPDAIHKTRLHIGEGLVGDIVAHARPLNLGDARQHPRFAYRPETGEDAVTSFVGVPILQGGGAVGVLTVQDATARSFTDEEVEALQTVAMVLAEVLSVRDETRATPATTQRFSGVALVDGLAMGQVVLHEPRVAVTRLIAEDTATEQTRLDRAIYELRRNVDTLLQTEDVAHAGEHLDVLQSYRMFANDGGWFRRIRAAIDTGLTADAAVERVLYDMRARLTGQRDAYLRDRLHDFSDLSNRLLRVLNARPHSASADKLPRATVLVARMMGPAELLDYDRRRLRGLVLEEGALGAHVTIVARALNIPLIGDMQGVVDAARDRDEVILDAEEGVVHLRPSPNLLGAYGERVRLRTRRMKRYARVRKLPAITRDGVAFKVGMNAGLAVDVEHIDESGADMIGLFRTELNFMVAARFPRVEEQTRFYRSVIERANGRRVVFRALDIGGDKALPYMRMRREDNPALGWRALRMSLDRPGLLRNQLRALLRASANETLDIMFPMVTVVDEFEKAREWLLHEKQRLENFGHQMPRAIRIGAMLEVPALIWQLDALLPRLDFLSIGANDLLQFFFASDRGNPNLATRYDPLNHASLCMFRDIQRAATRHNVPLTLCGELGGRPLEAMAFLGLGFRQISVPASAIGPVKRVIRSAHSARLGHALNALLDAPQTGNMRPALQQLAETQSIRL